MIPRLRPFFQLSDFKAAARTSKRAIETFEHAFAEQVNMNYALLLPLGRSAIYLFLKASGMEGKKVILPAYNCRVVASTVVASGNIPFFIDCKKHSFNIDLDKAISSIDNQTTALIVTAMYGYPVDTTPLKDLKERYPNIAVIGDSALGLYTESNNQHFCEHFDFSFFSFGLGKQMSIVEGGMMVTNRHNIYEAIKTVRDRLIINPTLLIRLKKMVAFLTASIFFEEHLYPFLYLFSEKTNLLSSLKGTMVGIEELYPHEAMVLPASFQTSIGCNQLKKLRENRIKRKRILQKYFKDLAGNEEQRFCLPPYHPELSHFPLLSDFRDELAYYLLRHNIHATNVFKEMPSDLPLLREFCIDEYPRAQSITDRCLLLPLYAQLQTKQQDYIIDRILAWQPKYYC